ncbi:16S rRNA (uracil(1498)-N(3))-methyltransferase [Paenisporosarcina cavernae]|uniref:Ribosomal RNA small subunit methyltransferase E n=1 Tax=Paenisporosarcina cavernae TaxID=2320858 RepID=A0A385YSX0_9BACL|nr:16S rRNA (uracil(1498)-N(3))-methyltransferase [Paenisporosarcina cavernae]AYC29624.1 16S rRNA (uracil(1498)-N(3))-methyltransferase [Paenisporosarcina cavernae]
MQRYFIDHPSATDRFSIVGEDAKHISKVMRMSVGDQIIVVNNGNAYRTEIDSLEDRVVHVKTIAAIPFSNELPVHVTIACGLPKGDKLELITQKATELGVSEIIPFQAERSIVKWEPSKSTKKLERLNRIAKEAAEQSHRTVIPTIQNVQSFGSLLNREGNDHHLFFAYEEQAKRTDRTSFSEHLRTIDFGQSIFIAFGPEGGFSPNEAQQFIAAGFKPIALGPRILRTETAPLYVLSAISYQFE